jgi:hypothetical protein
LPFLPPEKFSQEAYLWLSSLSSVASRKCGNFDRNGWKLSGVMTGNFGAESVETLERNNHRGSRMLQRWLAAILLHCEHGFKRIRGFASMPEVIRAIEEEQARTSTVKEAA